MPVEAAHCARPGLRADDPARPSVEPVVPPGDAAAMPVSDVRKMTDVLFTRLRSLEEGTQDYSYVRNTLVELNMGLVRHAASRFAHRSEPMEDIVQVGVVGLIKAINRFEPERELEFVTYALPTIVGEIKRHFRDTSWAVHVPRRLQELRLQLIRAGEALQSELGREPTPEELAAHLGISRAEVAEGQIAASAYAAGTLEAPGADEDDSPLHARLGRPEPALERIENLLSLKQAVIRLSERDRLILRLRFVDELTQQEIGHRVGISQMQVSRVLARILAHLRDTLTE